MRHLSELCKLGPNAIQQKTSRNPQMFGRAEAQFNETETAQFLPRICAEIADISVLRIERMAEHQEQSAQTLYIVMASVSIATRQRNEVFLRTLLAKNGVEDGGVLEMCTLDP